VDEEPERVRRSRQAHAGGTRATRISRTETAVPESGCLAAARGAERGRGVQRESLSRTASVPTVQGVPTGQCDHFRPPARSLGQPVSEGRTGLPIGFHRPPTHLQADCGWLGSRPGPEASCAGERRRRKRTTPRGESLRGVEGVSTGFRRATPVLRGRSRGATFRTPRRAGRARISRGVCFSGDSSLLRW
jgi:hypothetical protein